MANLAVRSPSGCGCLSGYPPSGVGCQFTSRGRRRIAAIVDLRQPSQVSKRQCREAADRQSPSRPPFVQPDKGTGVVQLSACPMASPHRLTAARHPRLTAECGAHAKNRLVTLQRLTSRHLDRFVCKKFQQTGLEQANIPSMHPSAGHRVARGWPAASPAWRFALGTRQAVKRDSRVRPCHLPSPGQAPS